MPGLIIRNGRIICPATHRDEIGDVWIESGRFRSPLGERPPEFEVLDATGMIVAPGFIDLHVHLRESAVENPEIPETIRTGTEAAAAGGFTTVCAMPNTRPVNDNPESMRFMVERAAAQGIVRVLPFGAATISSDGGRLTDFKAMIAAGAAAFSDDGKPVRPAALMKQALVQARELETFVSDHCEDLTQTTGGIMNRGETARSMGLEGLPAEAENSIVERDIRLSAETSGRVHIAHLSTQAALQQVKDAKSRGLPVTCEAAPHHFSLTEEDVARYGVNAKMKPPLRTRDDVEALRRGIAEGVVDAIATDHAPHAAREKERGLPAAPFGIIGLETAVGLAIKELLMPGHITWPRLVELFSSSPAKILRRRDLGRIEAGARGDLTLIDPHKQWTYQVSSSRSMSRNTPFDGWPFVGKAVATVVEGKLVYRD